MKTYLRFLWRNKLYTAIEFVGLSVALAFVIIFTCYIKQQYAVSNYYEDSENIYIVGIWDGLISKSNMPKYLQDNIPEVAQGVLVQNFSNNFTFEQELASKERLLVVGKDFFDLFKTKFIYGSPEDFNVATNAFVSESFAKRHGGLDIIGKKLVKDGYEAEIAGIIEDFTNTIFPNFEVVINAAHPLYNNGDEGYISYEYLTFIKVAPETDIEVLKGKLPDAIRNMMEYKGKGINGKMYSMARLDEIYFSELLPSDGLKRGNHDKIVIFSIVVLFLLISAIINYINLNIASAERRAKDLAIRHLFGEERSRMVQRIFLECFIFTLLSFVVALLIANLVLDGINRLILSGVPITIPYTAEYILIYAAIVLAISIICGISVSFIMPKIKIGSSTVARKSMSKLFIGLQCILSFIMIATALTMELQLKHILNRDMHANMDNIYYTDYKSEELLAKLKELPFVRSIGVTTGIPGRFAAYFETKAAEGDEQSLMCALLSCDTTAFRIFGFEKVKDFSPNNPIGTWMCESAATTFKIDENNRIWRGYSPKKLVAGVVKDVPAASLLRVIFEGVIPIINVAQEEEIYGGGYCFEVEHTKENKKILDEIVGEIYFKKRGRELKSHGFLRDLHKADYDQTSRDIRLIEVFMLIAIMLSSLAFFAMSVHYASNNRKPIAVHKVFGGDTSSELCRCMGVYFKIMAAAVAIGLPVSVWISSRYLEQFAYRINLADKWWIFVVAIAISLLISTATVLWQTLRAAGTNPVEALKSE